MSRTDAGDQATLTMFASDGSDVESDRCQAIAVSTSERCQRPALTGIQYCPEHYHLLDGEDMTA